MKLDLRSFHVTLVVCPVDMRCGFERLAVIGVCQVSFPQFLIKQGARPSPLRGFT